MSYTLYSTVRSIYRCLVETEMVGKAYHHPLQWMDRGGSRDILMDRKMHRERSKVNLLINSSNFSWGNRRSGVELEGFVINSSMIQDAAFT